MNAAELISKSLGLAIVFVAQACFFVLLSGHWGPMDKVLAANGGVCTFLAVFAGFGLFLGANLTAAARLADSRQSSWHSFYEDLARHAIDRLGIGAGLLAVVWLVGLMGAVILRVVHNAGMTNMPMDLISLGAGLIIVFCAADISYKRQQQFIEGP